MPMIMSNDGIEEKSWLNMLIYGPFGSGKTVLAATAEQCEETQHVLFIDAEGGTKSLQDAGIRPNVYRINTFKEFNKVHEFVRKHAKLRDVYLNPNVEANVRQEARDNLCKLQAWLYDQPIDTAPTDIKEPTLYRTVVIDSLTEVQKYIMYDILGIDINTTTLNQDQPLPQLQHWGKSSDKVRLVVRAFRDVAMHTIFCCLDQTMKDERDGSISIMPSLPGKLPSEVCGFLDIVGYMHVSEAADAKGNKVTKRFLQVQPVGKYGAKSRYRSLGQAVSDPTISKIMALINQGNKA